MSGATTATAAAVTVKVPARLHLGFLDLNGGLGRRFGSIGLAISDLGTRISVRRAPRMQVNGPESERALRYATTMQQFIGADTEYDLRVEEVVPSHAGLGSGTQLALAVAAGIRRLHGMPLDVAGDASRLGRGARSGIGIGLFDRGGLVVDGGRGSVEGPAPIISHMSFPENWRVLVVLDAHRQGVHGDDELAAFAHLPPISAADAGHLCRLVLMQDFAGGRRMRSADISVLRSRRCRRESATISRRCRAVAGLRAMTLPLLSIFSIAKERSESDRVPGGRPATRLHPRNRRPTLFSKAHNDIRIAGE